MPLTNDRSEITFTDGVTITNIPCFRNARGDALFERDVSAKVMELVSTARYLGLKKMKYNYNDTVAKVDRT